MRTICLALLLVLGSVGPVLAQSASSSRVATTAAAFLRIGVGARGVAMGETAVAHATDVSATYWNPALAASLSSSQAYFNYTDWFAGITLSYGSVMLNLGNTGQIGATVYVMNSGEMDITTELRPEGTGERFRVQDLMLGLTYSRSLTDRFDIGGTVKLVRSSIWNMSASTAAVDLGLTYRTPYDPVVLGLSITNFGGEMQLSGADAVARTDIAPDAGGSNDGLLAELRTRSWDLPVTFRIGLAYTVFETRNNKLLLSTDALYPNSNRNHLNAGVEYGAFDTFFVRAGYRQFFLDDREGGLSLGGGVHYMGIRADYAYSNWGALGAVQYVSLGVDF
jgi:hypothetical protein